MLIVVNVYIWDVLYKYRYLVIIIVVVYFNGGDSINVRLIILFISQKVCFLDYNLSLLYKFLVVFIFLNKNVLKYIYICKDI